MNLQNQVSIKIVFPEYENIELDFNEMSEGLEAFRKKNHYGEIGFTVNDLTVEERTEALRIARGVKQGKINEAEYAKKVNATQKDVPFTAEYLYESLKRHYTYLHGTFVDTDGRDKIYLDMCYYFSHDKRYSGNLNKGLLVRGEIGCGKTTMLEFFRKSRRRFNIVPCHRIAFEYKDKGAHAIIMYGKNHTDYPLVGTCFDDLGTEPDTKNFGDKMNVMAEIILMRYETKSVNTFITTNLTDPQILIGYEARAYDRLKEMFNEVTLPGRSLR